MPRRPAWRREHALRRLPSLRNRRDWQSVAYLAAQPALAAWQWVHGLSWPLYGLMLFLTLGVGVIHHNHAHRRLWRGRRANRATDFWLTLLQGHPTFVFHAAHNANHHRYVHGPRDAARRRIQRVPPDSMRARTASSPGRISSRKAFTALSSSMPAAGSLPVSAR